MATIERFEEIQAWQLARELCRRVYACTRDGAFARDWALRDQIRRAALSIMLNIAEGFARRTNQEFRQFLFIAHGSAAEVQSALYVALDQDYLTEEQFNLLYRLADRTSRTLSSFIKYLDRRAATQ